MGIEITEELQKQIVKEQARVEAEFFCRAHSISESHIHEFEDGYVVTINVKFGG